MENEPSRIKQQIEKLLEQEIDLYREILSLSKNQIELLSPDPDEAVLAQVISEKEDRFQNIQQIDKEVAELAKRVSIEPHSDQNIEAQIQEIRSLLTDIVELEKEGNKQVFQMTQDLQNRISKMQTGRQVIDRYGSGRKISSPIFVSIKR